MSGSSRGGRRASQPDNAWRPVTPLRPDGVSVLFIEESGGRSRVFDFGRLPVPEQIARWCARVLSNRFGARSAVKHVTTPGNLYGMLRMFALSLADSPVPVSSPADITAGHVEAFLAAKAHLASYGSYLSGLRTLLRFDGELPPAARAALFEARLPDRSQVVKDSGYGDEEFQAIMTVVRGDVRRARDRIVAGRRFLADYRGGLLAPDGRDAARGRLLDVFERTGEWPQAADGYSYNLLNRVGGLGRLAGQLCLTLDELSAFCLLLTALTGENYGTIARWPVAHYRPDGGDERFGIALLEQDKPRRGPEREHMVRPLEDLPPSLAELFEVGDADHRLLRSPLRVYLLLLDLSDLARRLSGLISPFCAFNALPGRLGEQWCEGAPGHRLKRWARRHGFPTVTGRPGTPGLPPLDVDRIRQTVTERRRRPVSHQRSTMNDVYLRRDRDVQEQSRIVVADALRAEVGKARRHQAVPVLSAALVELARTHPAQAAAQARLEPTNLKQLLAGEQDSVLVGCVDHHSGPYTDPGQPCTASFLACLDCENARALPRQLPVQIAAHDHLAALRQHQDPQTWQARYRTRLAQLDEIVGHYSAAEVERARAAVTATERRLVEELVDGRWDLR